MVLEEARSRLGMAGGNGEGLLFKKGENSKKNKR